MHRECIWTLFKRVSLLPRRSSSSIVSPSFPWLGDRGEAHDVIRQTALRVAKHFYWSAQSRELFGLARAHFIQILDTWQTPSGTFHHALCRTLSSLIRSAARSATAYTTLWILPEGSNGKMLASTIISPLIP